MNFNHPAGPCYGVDQDDAEQAEARQLSRRLTRARKRHVCDRCEDSIEPGESYYREALIVDGEFQTYHSHIVYECSRYPGACPTCKGWGEVSPLGPKCSDCTHGSNQ